MNATAVTTLATLITLATGTAAHASGAATNKVFISGPLILLFLGFCALVVVAQIIPVLSTIYGMLKGAKESKKEVPAEGDAELTRSVLHTNADAGRGQVVVQPVQNGVATTIPPLLGPFPLLILSGRRAAV